MKPKPNRGGARPNAGRQNVGRSTVVAWLDEMEWLDSMREAEAYRALTQ